MSFKDGKTLHKTTTRLPLTIHQYLQLIKHDKLINTPVFNRGKVAKPDWQRGIITSIYRGLDLPKFVLWIPDAKLIDAIKKDVTKGFDILLDATEWRYPILDGVQRTHSIMEFAKHTLTTESTLEFFHDGVHYGHRDVGGQTFKDLEDLNADIAAIFSNYIIDVTLFYGTDEEASAYFIALNNGNPMNDQQKRNALISAVGDFIRLSANVEHSTDDTRMGLFETQKVLTGAKGARKETLKGKYISTPVSKMQLDKWLAYVIAYSSFQRGLPKDSAVAGIETKNLNDMYSKSYKYDFGLNDQDKNKQIRKLVEENCNDILRMLRNQKYYKQASLGACLNIYLLIDYLRLNKILKIDDPEKFADWFFKIHTELCKPVNGKESDYRVTTRLGFTKTFLNSRLNYIWDEFKKEVKTDANGSIVLGPYPKLGIRILDMKRNISDKDAIEIFHDQDAKCAVSGDDITQLDMIKAHKKPWSEGGMSTPSNIVLTTKAANRPVVEELVLPDGEEEEEDDEA